MTSFAALAELEAIDGLVRQRLGSSLEHIAEKAEGHLEFERSRFASALNKIRSRRQHPGVFARYYELISALTSGRLDDAKILLDEIIDLATASAPQLEIVPYERDLLGSDYDRFPRLMFAEFDHSNPMATPSPSQSSASEKSLNEAIDIVARVDPAIHAEIKALLVRIYLAAGNKNKSVRRFGGVTSFLTWGASFANIEFYKTRWDMVQFLVHEITHGLLFGLSFDEPLVLNSPDENYKSPLRLDLRPMDGIFHATLVCGRLVDFNKAWLDSGLAEGSDKKLCQEAVESNARLFHDGVEVILEHGKLSERGHQLIEQAERDLLVNA